MNGTWSNDTFRHLPVSHDCTVDLGGQYLDSNSVSDSPPANTQLPFQSPGQGMRKHSMASQPRQSASADMGMEDMHRYPPSTQLLPGLQIPQQRCIQQELQTAQFQKGKKSSSAKQPAAETAESSSVSSTQEKRRAQNRSAQRAFRIRKLNHVKHLEQDLTALLSEHNELLTSYEKQEDVLTALRTRISTLQNELAQLRGSCGRDQEFGGMIVPERFEGWDFDAGIAASNGNGAYGFRASFDDKLIGPGNDF